MTWYEDVDRRLDNLERVVMKILVEIGQPKDAVRMSVPGGAPPLQSNSLLTVTPEADDDDDDLDFPPDPVPVGCSHNQQALIAGIVTCAKCGHKLSEPTGLIQPNTPPEQMPGWAQAAMEGGPSV